MTNENNRAADEAYIRGLIEERVRAIRAGDVDALMSAHAPDVVMFDALDPLRYAGSEADVLEERTRQFNEALAELTLVLPDVSIAEGSFIEVLGSFEERVRALRGYYTQRAANTLVERALNDPNYRGEPVPHLPLGTLIDVTDDGQGRIMSAKETRAYILGAANPLIPDESELEEQSSPSNSKMSADQS